METIKIVEYVRSNSIKRNKDIQENMYTTNGECYYAENVIISIWTSLRCHEFNVVNLDGDIIGIIKDVFIEYTYGNLKTISVYGKLSKLTSKIEIDADKLFVHHIENKKISMNHMWSEIHAISKDILVTTVPNKILDFNEIIFDNLLVDMKRRFIKNKDISIVDSSRPILDKGEIYQDLTYIDNGRITEIKFSTRYPKGKKDYVNIRLGKVIECVKRGDDIEEISIKLGVCTKTIYRDIDKLKKKGLL
jgi:sporulation protein YlmC with PRC-barrel domain